MKTIHHLSRQEAIGVVTAVQEGVLRQQAEEIINHLYENGYEVCKEEWIFKALNLRSEK